MKASTISVGTSPTLIESVSYESRGMIIQNSGDTPIFLGDDSVAAIGLSLAAGQTLTLPAGSGRGFALYGVVASGTGTVSLLAL